MDLKAHIRSIPDFPKKGILFYDIGSLLAHPAAWRETVERMTQEIKLLKPDFLVGIESRGFLIGTPVAMALGIGMAMVRKKGKLPGATMAYHYDLEYGSDTVEIQEGIIPADARVVIIDDLLATGGTASAAIALTRKIGANVVGAAFIMELSFLNGREKLGVPTIGLLSYDE